MLRSLDGLRRGSLNPSFFELNETARRVEDDFHLSKSKDIEPNFRYPPLSMEVEMSEGR